MTEALKEMVFSCFIKALFRDVLFSFEGGIFLNVGLL